MAIIRWLEHTSSPTFINPATHWASVTRLWEQDIACESVSHHSDLLFRWCPHLKMIQMVATTFFFHPSWAGKSEEERSTHGRPNLGGMRVQLCRVSHHPIITAEGWQWLSQGVGGSGGMAKLAIGGALSWIRARQDTSPSNSPHYQPSWKNVAHHSLSSSPLISYF